MLKKSYIFIAAHLFIATSTSVAMEQITDAIKPESAAFLNNNQVAIAGEGCIIFDAQSRKPIHIITQEKVSHIAANSNKTFLALSTRRGTLLHDIKTSNQSILENGIKEGCFVTFSPSNNTLFAFYNPQLSCYDRAHNKVTNYTLPSNYTSIMGDYFISCHPNKQETIYPNAFQHLSIVQLDNKPLIKTIFQTNFECSSADYSPDGNTVALCSLTGKYFTCSINSSPKQLSAYQLIVDDKKYCASTFHPHYSIIFLLSRDGYIHYFDYKTLKLIVAAKQLTKKLTFDPHERKRLDCDKYGKQLVVACVDTWAVLDIPQNNFIDIIRTLHHKQVPKELIKMILLTIINSHQKSYDYFDLQALHHITPIQKPIREQTIEESMELETETKTIHAVCVESMKDYQHPIFSW